jgi:hypothetical protein
MVGSTQGEPPWTVTYSGWCWVSWYSDIDVVYQEKELPPSFAVNPSAWLNDLVGDADDIEMPIIVKQKMEANEEKSSVA